MELFLDICGIVSGKKPTDHFDSQIYFECLMVLFDGLTG